jgi:hypothetical protein
METNWARGWGPALHKITVQNNLRNATETLIKQITPLLDRTDAAERAEAEKAIEAVRLVINTIDTEAAVALRSVTTPGS